MKKYSRVSYEDRCQIYALLKSNISIPVIATQLGFHKSTVYREINRNSEFANGFTFKKIYSPLTAQKRAIKSAARRKKKSLITNNLRDEINFKLKIGWSPELISGRLKLERKFNISHQTIYRYVYKNPELLKLLRFGSKRGVGRHTQRKFNRQRFKSIHQRPNSVNQRRNYGHWERDGIYGANKQQLLVCLERKSRLIKVGLIEDRSSEEINNLTLSLLQGHKLLSMTNDNGSEFRKKMKVDIPHYVCDPFKPQQRGSVENVIGVMRRYVSRKTDLVKLGQKKIQEIENLINFRPRKMFGYKSSFEVYYKKRVALVM